MRVRLGGVLLLAAGLLIALPASAQSLEGFYKGSQIRLIIGSTPGGDYDLWSRIIGRYMAPHVPGQPTIVPQNMPGGGDIVAANHLQKGRKTRIGTDSYRVETIPGKFFPKDL